MLVCQSFAGNVLFVLHVKMWVRSVERVATQ
jgi:hypothetical protein